MADLLDMLFATVAVVAAGGAIAAGQPVRALLTLAAFAAVALLAGSKQAKYRTLAITLIAFTGGLLLATLLVPAALRFSPGLARPDLINLLLEGAWALILAWALVPFGRLLRDMNYRIGRITAGAVAAGLAAAVLYAVWFAYYYRGPGLPFRESFPTVRALVPAALIFALGNAFFEEVIFRGIMMKTLAEFTDRVTVAVLLQALLYALAFISATAVPAGWPGVLANLVLALFLGWTVVRTGGIALAMMVHFAVSLAVALIR